MLSLHVLAALLTAIMAASGSPTPKDALDAALENRNVGSLDTRGDEANDIETIYFKREGVIAARDLELAKRHGIDANEMWKHSVVRRSEGDDITFWVHNSWVDSEELPNGLNNANGTDTTEDEEWEEEDGDEEVNRLESRQVTSFKFNRGKQSRCKNTKFEGRTGGKSPTTGAAKRIRDWARKNKGYFSHSNVYRSVRMIAARGGTNAEFSARKQSVNKLRPNIYVGTKDIADIVEKSLKRYTKRRGGAYRVQARGTTSCEANGVSGWNRANVIWALSKSGLTDL